MLLLRLRFGRWRTLITLMVILGSWELALSQTSRSDSAAYELEEVKVQSTMTGGNLLRQAAALAILRKADLERDAGIAIIPALNRVPGLYMQSGALNTNRITMRGIGSRSLFASNKVRAYLDDIPLTSGDGETTLEDIDPSLLGRVEIIKGPASSIFGAGLGGVINLFTAHPGVQQTKLEAGLTAGSYGLFRQLYRLHHSQKNSAWTINVNDTYLDGYRENNAYDRTSVNVIGRLYQENSKTSILGSWISLKAFIPSSLDSAGFAENPRQAAFNWAQVMGFEDYDKAFLGISHSQDLNAHWKIKASFFAKFRSAYELRPFNILRENNQSLGTRSYLEHQRGSWNVKLGAEYFWENYSWQTNEQQNRQLAGLLSDQQENRRFYNLFAQADIQMNTQIQLTAGLNFNETRYSLQDYFQADSLDQTGDYAFAPQLSPRIALLYAPSPTQSFYAQLSHGFSPPSVAETLTPEGAINPEIQPETGWNVEIGAKSLSEKRFNYDLSLFYMAIRNLLVARQTDFDQFVGVNAGATRHIGLEAGLQYQLTGHDAKIRLSAFANANIGQYRFEEFMDGDTDYSGNPLTGVPSTTMNAGLDLSSKVGLYANVNANYVSAISLRDDNSVYSDPFQIFRTKIGWQWKLLKTIEINIFAGIDNIFNTAYASMILPNAGSFGGRPPRYFYPGLPRNYYLGAKLQWELN